MNKTKDVKITIVYKVLFINIKNVFKYKLYEKFTADLKQIIKQTISLQTTILV